MASGAFHEHKPSELLAELQGRLPIRVELKGLDARDLERILTETRFNLLEQQRALLEVEGANLEFERDAVSEIAKLAADVNRSVENIGARRLHTVIERIMEDISYNASELGSLVRATGKGEEGARAKLEELTGRLNLQLKDAQPADAGAAPTAAGASTEGTSTTATANGGPRVVISKDLVRKKLLPMLERSDFSKFIL